MRKLFLPILLASATAAIAATTSHFGLLSNPEMEQVLKNAKATQKLLFPEQQISACWPYDTGLKGSLTGLARCKVETAKMLNGTFRPVRGPDMDCSYTHEEFCDVKQAAK